MSNKRIYQIAKELNIAHHDIVKFLRNKGIDVTNHMMPVDNSIYSSIMMEFSKEKKQVDRILKEKARQAIVSTKKNILVETSETTNNDSINKNKQDVLINKTIKKDNISKLEKKIDDKKDETQKHNLKKVVIPNLTEKLHKSTKVKGSTKKLNIADSLSKLNKKSKKKIKRKNIEDDNINVDDKKVIKVPEFLTVDELSKMMKVSAQEIIMQCMDLGLMVTINQRLDMDIITMVSDEFGYTVETLDTISTSLDSLTASFDSRFYLGGTLFMAGANDSHYIVDFTGNN